jgi:hypothetical protein
MFYWNPDAGYVLVPDRGYSLHPNDINNHGAVVGGGRVGLYWPDFSRSPEVLQSPSPNTDCEALALNDNGLIVGECHLVTGSVGGRLSWGVIWWKGKVWQADALVTDQTSLWIERLDHVSNQGRIAGLAREPGADGGSSGRARPIIIDVLVAP